MKKIIVKVIPRSSRSEVVGEMADGVLKVKLTAPPVDGKANEALITLLAKYFGVKKTSVHILKGKTARIKIVHISSD